MAHSKEYKDKAFDRIIYDIEINALSTRKSIKKAGISNELFYQMIDSDEQKAKQYARACKERCEALADEIIDIADDTKNDKTIVDGVEMTNHEAINRSRLKVDSRKWLLSKLYPKKYGEKLDVTSDGDKLATAPIHISIDNKDINLE